jgi:hypothetical protein
MSKTRVYGIVARDAPIAVLFRRGPTRKTRMLLWRLEDDALIPGQWFIGRIHVGPSGLSPNGELLLYYATKGLRKFTAISRPPYFTALALWGNDSPWTCGGFFDSDSKVVLGLKFGDPYTRSPIADLRSQVFENVLPSAEAHQWPHGRTR